MKATKEESTEIREMKNDKDPSKFLFYNISVIKLVMLACYLDIMTFTYNFGVFTSE